MKNKFVILLLVMVACLGLFGCKKDFKECSSTLLDISSGNYTIEILDNSQYKGVYYVTKDIIKKSTASTTYYYFKNDDYRYYRTLSGWNKVEDNNKINQDIFMITSFFTNSVNLFVNKDNTVFKTKTGNLIYNINSTTIKLDTFDTTKQNLEVLNLNNNESYVITPSAIRISDSENVLLYVKKTSGISKYIYKSSHWKQSENDITSLEDLRDDLLKDIGTDFIKEGDMYLNTNKFSLQEFTGALCYDYAIIPYGSYTLKDFSTGYVYNVDDTIIRVTMGDKFVVYRMENDTIFEYTNDNFNNHIVKRVSEQTSLDDIMVSFTVDFKYSYGNISYSNYMILGEKSEYELYGINETTVIAAQITAEEVSDIKPILYGKNYTLKNKKTNICYTVSNTVLEIYRTNTQEKEYYSFEENAVYNYYYNGSEWIKQLTQYTGIYDSINFDELFKAVNEDNILKVLKQNSNYDFESENFYILNYDKNIDIELPNV